MTIDKKNVPFFSAHSTKPRAALSLTEPPGFINSAFPKISHPVASDNDLIRICSVKEVNNTVRACRDGGGRGEGGRKEGKRTKGVFPIAPMKPFKGRE